MYYAETLQEGGFCCRVFVRDTVTIPPRNEAIVFGRKKNPEGAARLGIAESVKEGKLIESGAMVARTVVDMSEVQSDMVPMRVFNPTLEPITVKKSDIGKVTPAVSCEKMDVQDSCHNDDDDEDVKDVIKRIPPHLQELYWVSVTEFFFFLSFNLKEVGLCLYFISCVYIFSFHIHKSCLSSFTLYLKLIISSQLLSFFSFQYTQL